MKLFTLKKFGILLLSLFLAACGGSSYSPTSSAVIGLNNSGQEVINGIVVPPEPDRAAMDATIAGVDTDNNGIRDEIDRFIATKYGDKPGVIEAMKMIYVVKQELANSNPLTQEQALAMAYKSMDTGGCAGRKFDIEGAQTSNIFNESMIRTYNTRARIDARKRVFKLAGMITRNVKDTTIVCPYTRQ